MDTKTYLKQARTYEFNSMQAKLRNNNDIADRYECMSKMSMIDAVDSFNNFTPKYKKFSSPSNQFYGKKDLLICIIIFCGVLILMCIFNYFLSNYLL